MFIHWLWKIARNNGGFRTGVESDFHGVVGHQLAVYGQTEGAYMSRPARVFSVGKTAAASRMGEVIEKAGLRKCARWLRSVDLGVVLYYTFR